MQVAAIKVPPTLMQCLYRLHCYIATTTCRVAAGRTWPNVSRTADTSGVGPCSFQSRQPKTPPNKCKKKKISIFNKLKIPHSFGPFWTQKHKYISRPSSPRPKFSARNFSNQDQASSSSSKSQDRCCVDFLTPKISLRSKGYTFYSILCFGIWIIYNLQPAVPVLRFENPIACFQISLFCSCLTPNLTSKLTSRSVGQVYRPASCMPNAYFY